MEKQVEKEGEKEKELYDKFMCYCKSSTGDLADSIAAAETKIPAVTSDIESSQEEVKTLKEELKEAQTDRAEAKKAMAEATGIRKKRIGSLREAQHGLQGKHRSHQVCCCGHYERHGRWIGLLANTFSRTLEASCREHAGHDR